MERECIMKKISPQHKLSNSTGYNAFLFCGIAFMSQIPRRCGYIAVYAVTLLWLLMIINSVWLTYVLICSRDNAGTKEHRRTYKTICVMTIICCIGLSWIAIPFVKDSIKGTETFTTSYYQSFSKSKELLVYYPNGHDKYIYLTKSQYEYIDSSCTEIDKSHTMKISDNISVYAHKQGITVEYYPNSRITKHIEIEQ